MFSGMSDQHFRTKLCPFLFGSRGECAKGNECSYAHSIAELRTRPDLTKTKLCDAYMKGNCFETHCKWAHGRHELRFTGDFYKTSLCKYWVESVCYAGAACRHAHGQEELRIRKTPSTNTALCSSVPSTPSVQGGSPSACLLAECYSRAPSATSECGVGSGDTVLGQVSSNAVPKRQTETFVERAVASLLQDAPNEKDGLLAWPSCPVTEDVGYASGRRKRMGGAPAKRVDFQDEVCVGQNPVSATYQSALATEKDSVISPIQGSPLSKHHQPFSELGSETLNCGLEEASPLLPLTFGPTTEALALLWDTSRRNSLHTDSVGAKFFPDPHPRAGGSTDGAAPLPVYQPLVEWENGNVETPLATHTLDRVPSSTLGYTLSPLSSSAATGTQQDSKKVSGEHELLGSSSASSPFLGVSEWSTAFRGTPGTTRLRGSLGYAGAFEGSVSSPNVHGVGDLQRTASVAGDSFVRYAPTRQQQQLMETHLSPEQAKKTGAGSVRLASGRSSAWEGGGASTPDSPISRVSSQEMVPILREASRLKRIENLEDRVFFRGTEPGLTDHPSSMNQEDTTPANWDFPAFNETLSPIKKLRFESARKATLSTRASPSFNPSPSFSSTSPFVTYQLQESGSAAEGTSDGESTSFFQPDTLFSLGFPGIKGRRGLSTSSAPFMRGIRGESWHLSPDLFEGIRSDSVYSDGALNPTAQFFCSYQPFFQHQAVDRNGTLTDDEVPVASDNGVEGAQGTYVGAQEKKRKGTATSQKISFNLPEGPRRRNADRRATEMIFRATLTKEKLKEKVQRSMTLHRNTESGVSNPLEAFYGLPRGHSSMSSAPTASHFVDPLQHMPSTFGSASFFHPSFTSSSFLSGAGGSTRYYNGRRSTFLLEPVRELHMTETEGSLGADILSYLEGDHQPGQHDSPEPRDMESVSDKPENSLGKLQKEDVGVFLSPTRMASAKQTVTPYAKKENQAFSTRTSEEPLFFPFGQTAAPTIGGGVGFSNVEGTSLSRFGRNARSLGFSNSHLHLPLNLDGDSLGCVGDNGVAAEPSTKLQPSTFHNNSSEPMWPAVDGKLTTAGYTPLPGAEWNTFSRPSYAPGLGGGSPSWNPSLDDHDGVLRFGLDATFVPEVAVVRSPADTKNAAPDGVRAPSNEVAVSPSTPVD